MPQNLLVDKRDVEFVLFEMLGADDLAGHAAFNGRDSELFRDTLSLAEKIAIEQWYPVDGPGDEEGVHYDPGTMNVAVPDFFHEPYRSMTRAGFIGMSDDPAVGGMGMPQCISLACKEYFCAASAALAFFSLLTGSAAGLIRRYGTDIQKDLFLKKMLQGSWAGTMCLTEPGAGSDVGGIRTRAVPVGHGAYRIEGQKIFISAGEHDLAENIIHLVLARIEGAPAGTKGLSLFIVPKFLVRPDGTVLERNGVFCRGVEKKMGFHGSPTCSLSFGEERPCTGYLLGDQGAGMKLMFTMMNEERLFCGLQGLAASSSAYLHALDYAKQRFQGAHFTKMLDPSAEKTAIIDHPDVKRMLFWMKSHVEGMRMLTYYLALCLDRAEADCGDTAAKAHAMVELLVPICKAGNTDMVWLVTAEAIQVMGGYGFCRDYPVERMARECKVLSIVEGTNGIQSMDLVLRKILMNPDNRNYAVFRNEVAQTVMDARNVVDAGYLILVERALEKMDRVVSLMQDYMKNGMFGHILSQATPIQQAMYLLCLAWMHVWGLSVSIPKLNECSGSDGTEAAFYKSRVLSSRFFLGTEFPKFFGRVEGILRSEAALMEADSNVFLN